MDESLHSKFRDADALLERAAELLTRQAIDKALNGDSVALRLCIERFSPPKKERYISFSLPDIDGVHDLPRATHALLRGVSKGELTPVEAAAVAKLIEIHIGAIEAADFDQRLTNLEGVMSKTKNDR